MGMCVLTWTDGKNFLTNLNKINKHIAISVLVLVIIAVYGCAISANIRTEKGDHFQPGLFVIQDVTVIPMTEHDTILDHANVVIQGNKIVSINGIVPVGAQVIAGKGKWLIPGLIDMHVHNLADINFGSSYPTKGANFFIDSQDFMWLYVANGVTTALELSGRTEHFGQRNDIVKGNIVGPRIALSALINGGEGDGFIANTPTDGRQTVRIAKGMGYDFIKPYGALTAETFKAIVDEAGKQGMKTVGHIPVAFKDRLPEAFEPNFSLVAHAEEYSRNSADFSDDDARKFARLAKANNTWLCPTLITMVRIAEQSKTLDSIRSLRYFEEIHPLMQSKWLTANRYHIETSPERIAYFDSMVHFHYRLVKIFQEEGVPIVAGTDAGTSGVVWGYALHDELQQLVKAGLTPKQSLKAATRMAATWLQLGDKVGTIEAGKLADLVLLDANPLENISNTRKIAGVFVDGRWVDKASIDSMRSAIAIKHRKIQSTYNWSKRKEE